MRGHLGEDHMDVVKILENLANIMQDQGALREAQEIYTKILPKK